MSHIKLLNIIINRLCASIAMLCIVLVFTACNNDVFLDEPDMPEMTEVTLEGDGGEASYSISKKGLEHISLDLFSENERYCTYYNSQGEKVDSKVPASELGNIVFETNFALIKIVKEGNRLTIRSLCNASSMDDHYNLRLEYDYGVRYINIVITPGLPLKIKDISYDPRLHVNDNGRIVTSRSSYTNDTSMPWDIEVRPYLQTYASTLVEPDQKGSWAKGNVLAMKVPVYVDGKWELAEKECVRFGDTNKFYLPLSEQMITVPITVPVNSKVEVVKKIFYTAARIDGSITYENQVLGKQLDVNFTATSYYPVNYEINVENAD